MEGDFNNILTGLRVQTQIPLNVKNYCSNELTLSDLGEGDNLAYLYEQGLVVYCVEESTRWEWREVLSGEENTGLLVEDFIYPDGIITFDIDYSNRSFNFFPYLIEGERGLTGPQGPEGPQGIQGIQGLTGATGPAGSNGTNGVDGINGLSAYEIAVSEGFVGDETAWLLSLVGPEGPQGEPTSLDGVNLQFVLNNPTTTAEIFTNFEIVAPNFKFEADETTLDLQNHLTSTTGNNNLIISSSNTPSGITTGFNNVIIGNPTGLPSATNDTVILTNAVGNIVLIFTSSSYNARLPLQTITNINAGGLKSIITLEYLQEGYKPLNYITKSANYNVLPTDGTIDCTTNTFTITLPSPGTILTGKEFVIKNSGTGVITIDTAGGELIDGTTTVTLSTQYEKIRVQFTGTKYIII